MNQDEVCLDNEEFVMSTNPSFPSRKPPESKPNERPGIGIFTMLGLGLLVLFLIVVVVVLVRGVFTPV